MLAGPPAPQNLLKPSGNSLPTKDPSTAAYLPLATVAPESVDEVQALEGAEMGFIEQYEKPEGRGGDALAQIIALVSLSIL
jgi:hypothetical protein